MRQQDSTTALVVADKELASTDLELTFRRPAKARGTVAPRLDSATFQTVLTSYRAEFANRGNPVTLIQDTVWALLTQHHPRLQPLQPAQADSLTPGRVLAAYRDRFGDASDFTFIVVGSTTRDRLRPLVRRYLGNLPVLRRGEQMQDLGVRPPPGIITCTIYKGRAPFSGTAPVFSDRFEPTQEHRFMLSRLIEVLQLRLLARLREQIGGAYAVFVFSQVEEAGWPMYGAAIGFASVPARTDELVAAIFAELDSLRQHGPGADELVKVKETLIRSREIQLKENEFWVSALAQAARRGQNPRELLFDWRQQIEQLTADDLRQAVQRFLDPQRYIRVTLMPE